MYFEPCLHNIGTRALYLKIKNQLPGHGQLELSVAAAT